MSFCKKNAVVIAVIAVLVLYAQAQRNLSTTDLEALKQIEETYRTAWLKADEKTILSLFTDDATLYPNGNPPVKGKDEMRRFWFAPSETVTAIDAFDVKIDDIGGSENFAAVTGANEIRWTSRKKGGTQLKRFVSKGYFISIYIRQNREWKIFKQFWNGKTKRLKKEKSNEKIFDGNRAFYFARIFRR